MPADVSPALQPTRLERNLLVPLPDGETLAADLRIPTGDGPYPALVSYYPYRKDDVIGTVYEHANTFFAERGYAVLLVDFRGLGSSSGIAADAMDAGEADDLRELLAWTAAQPWCDGNVGMFGLSYGGITALRAAAAGSPHLKAIAPIMAMADPYRDWFYPGGRPNMLGAMSIWGPMMLAMQLAPPMFQDPGGRWRRVWWERLEARPYMLPWLEHPERDGYWAGREIELERITVPTFLVGGWRDLFPAPMADAYGRVAGERRLLMGPWLHTSPDTSPFEQVDHLEEIHRFFERWLRGAAEGVGTGATYFVQGAGVWRHEEAWPPAGEPLTLFLQAAGGLAGAPGPAATTPTYRGDPTVGAHAGLWDPLGTGFGLPLDQGPDDRRSLTFTGEPLEEPLELAGAPEATLWVSLDEGEELQLAAKLCEVRPDGSSALVTTGWLEAGHRDGHALREPIPASEPVEYRIRLWTTAYRLAAESRLRLSLSCADFPRVWPSRSNPSIRVWTGREHPSELELPVVPISAEPPPVLPVPDPGVNRAPGVFDSAPRWMIERDLVGDGVTVRTGMRLGLRTPGDDGKVRLDHHASASVSRERPDAARAEGRVTMELDMPDGSAASVVAESLVRGGSVSLSGSVSVEGHVVFERRWTR